MLKEPAVRVAPIMAILPQLQVPRYPYFSIKHLIFKRVVNRMQEDMVLNHAFDVFHVEDTFRNVINCCF